MNLICSPAIQQYFDSITRETNRLYEAAKKAREKGFDPEPKVDILLATSVAQRVEGLISSVAPSIQNSGLAQRITELEEQYSAGDWRIALLIAEEVTKEKFCKFKDLKEVAEVGIRTGLAYITMGIIAAPLEGLVEVKLKKRRDGKNYLALYYAGPIRGAGGTAEAISVVIADYIRRKLGIADYDPTDEEIKRYQVEIDDYLSKVAHRQYKPTAAELALIIRNIKVEITGSPTERYEVSQSKRLERVETDLIRGGMALVITEGVSLKAEKLWKNLSKWKDEFGLADWDWLKEFIKLKNEIHSVEAFMEKGSQKVLPIDSYLSDMVAGRPVFGYPLRSGGFRLRYGRTRTSGFAATNIHPATMATLNNYVATGTQVKVERPGKATVVSPADSIDGPIVKLKDGSVLRLETEEQAKQARSEVKEIIYLGDILVSYGDFAENNMHLVPAGYCEEWWQLEAEKVNPNIRHPKSAQEAIELSERYSIPLHPRYTFFWKEISKDEFTKLFDWFQRADFLVEEPAKRILEVLGCPHRVKDNKVIFDEDEATILGYVLNSKEFRGMNGLECANSVSKILIRDKSGTFIGARMGRPEKAKIRKLKGSPHGLFPVGSEGGRLRSLNEAVTKGTVTADFPIYECESCKKITIYPVCESCNSRTTPNYICTVCKKKTRNKICHGQTRAYEKKKIDVAHYTSAALKATQLQNPLKNLVKGVRGTWNKTHTPENLIKVILRAKHNVHVNKDGTIRYDMTELGLTHFKPKEIEASVQKLKALGYEFDKDGKPLEDENQILEIKPQDVILPSCAESKDEGADVVLIRICNFVDELLEKLYGLPKIHNVKTKEDLIGQLVIGLAPHTSGGTVGRIIGFSKTQGCFAHPYWHAAQRRNLDGDETCIILMMDAFLNFSRQYLPDRRGGRSMDAPLVLTTVLIPSEVDTEVQGLDVVSRYPLELYEGAQAGKHPGEIKVEQIKHRLNSREQYETLRYTHEVSDINSGVRVSAYKEKPTMVEKLDGQIDLANKIRAVDLEGVASLVIDKHFIRDIKGNLRKFTKQEFRCTTCNEKYRRPLLAGYCTKCNGKLAFTIAEGTIKKYLDASVKLVIKEHMPTYLQQAILLLERRIESIFGKEETKQTSLLTLLSQDKTGRIEEAL